MRRSLDAVTDRVEDLDRLTRRVLVVVGVAFVLRLAFLGSRIAHYDEGRVAWWSMHFHETGQFEYRYIIHGPFVQHVNRYLFGLVGPNDFTMRLVVAVAGGLLPLAALFFRDRLRDLEVLGVAFFLAVNPILLYYSRFFRSTFLVAAFSLVAFGYLLRAYDRGSVRAFHVGVAFVALAFAAKESALVYIVCWVGAVGVVVGHAVLRIGGERDESRIAWTKEWFVTRWERRGRYWGMLPRFLGHLVLAAVVFFAISLFFYAPRTPNSAAVGLWDAVVNPTRMPALVDATWTDVMDGYDYWLGGAEESRCPEKSRLACYREYLDPSLAALDKYAAMLVLLAVVGTLLEYVSAHPSERDGNDDAGVGLDLGYARAAPRYLVVATAAWGFVSVFGYPLGTDIANAWIMVNALVPLAIPAGVGLARVVRVGRNALDTDPVVAALTGFVLFVVVAQIVFAGVTGVYLEDTSRDNELVQYAQPADDFRPSMQVLRERAGSHEGTDVLFVGSEYVREFPRDEGITPRCSQILDVLPVQWYVEAYGATGDCEATFGGAVENMSAHDPLVVVAPAQLEPNLEPALEGYDSEVHRLRAWGSEAVFFTWTPEAETAEETSTDVRRR